MFSVIISSPHASKSSDRAANIPDQVVMRRCLLSSSEQGEGKGRGRRSMS